MRSVALIAVFLTAQLAGAGGFGGFSADEKHYLDGRDRVCQPLAKGAVGEPVCSKASARELAEAGFRKTPPVSGGGAYRASASGMQIELFSADGRSARKWSAGGVVSRVAAVYVSPKARVVAVEYQARVLGRAVTAVVGFEMPKTAHVVDTGGGLASGSTSQGATGPSGLLVAGKAKRDKKLAADIAIGQKQLARRKYSAAKLSFDKLLTRHPDDPAVLYGVAASHAGVGQKAEAVDFLRKLGALAHAEVPIWMVEARNDRAFDNLRADAEFRRAIGLDPGGRVPSAYEQAVGLGGIWEQAGSPCTEPQVELRLDRSKQTFRLTISSDCQGIKDRTRLSGRWTAQGEKTLTLIFPNPGQDDETLECELRTCDDGQEMCSDCGAGSDMGFVLRPTRR